MTTNRQISPLPFWLFGTKITKQHHLKHYGNGKTHPIITTYTNGVPQKFKIPPFQLRSATFGAVTAVQMIDLETGTPVNITTEITAAGLTTEIKTGYNSVVYPGTEITKNITQGEHYITITDGSETWYSDVFVLCLESLVEGPDYVKIEWWNDEDYVVPGGTQTNPHEFIFEGLGTPYKNRVILKTTPAMPDYPIQEEEPDRAGQFFQLDFISSKMGKFKCLITEEMMDCITLIGGHSNIELTYDGDTYAVDKFLATPGWQNGGLLTLTECEFHTGTIQILGKAD